MSSSKHTRIPNKPILSSTTTKVVSGKVVKTGVKATTPQRAKPKKLVQQQKEVSAIHPILKNDKKEIKKSFSESETDSEKPRTPRNSNQNSFSSTQSNQSNQVTPKRDSLESLKKQINDLSKYSFQQSQLFKKLHADLVRAELVTGNSDPCIQDTQNPDQFSFVGQRLHFLLENYISQNERLKKIGGIEQAEKQFYDYSDRAIQTEKLCQEELGKKYTIDQLSQILQNGKTVKSRGIDLSDAGILDNELGKKVRNLFDEGSGNDTIVSHIESINYFAESMKSLTGVQDDDINSQIRYLKNRIRESDELRAKNEEMQRENDILEHRLKDTQDKLHQLSNDNNDDQQVLNTVKSFYPNCSSPSSMNQFIQQDLELSNKVRNIFNDDDNNEAILRTIQSNKDSANDNTKIAELSSKLRQLQRNQDGDISIEPTQADNEAIENLNIQHQQELAQKDSQIIQLRQENSYLRSQAQNLSNSIQNLNEKIQDDQQEIAQKEAQITKLIAYNQDLQNSAPSQEIAEKESQIIQLTQENGYLKSQAQRQTFSMQKEIDEKDSQIVNLTNLVEELKSHAGNAAEISEDIARQQKQEIEQRDSQISHLTQENDQLKNQAQNQADSIQKLNDTIRSSHQSISEKDMQITDLTRENEQLRNLANNAQSQSESHQQILSEKDSQIATLTYENEQLRNKANNAQNQAENHQQALSEKDSQIATLTRENEQLRSQANSAQNQAENHQQALSEKDSQIESLTRENEQLRNQANSAQNQAENHQQILSEKDAQIESLTRENEQLKSQSADQSNTIQSLNNKLDDLHKSSSELESQLRQENSNKLEKLEQRLSEFTSQINQLTQENDYLQTQGQTQAISILELHTTIDEKQRQIGQKQEELNEAYRRLELEGKENEEQRRDRELSTKVREVFNSCPEDSIVNFIKKDVELASSIRYIYQSGDDPYIITKIRGEHHENETILAENSHLTEENSQLRNQISEKNKINEQREKENDELRKVMNNVDDVKNKEIDYLKKELLTSLDRQKELENLMTSKDNENDKLKNQIDSIAEKDKEINQLKEEKEEQINLFKNNSNLLESKIQQKDKEINRLLQLQEDQMIQVKREISIRDNEINQLKTEKENRNKNVDLFQSVTNIFHPDLSDDEIKNQSQRIKLAAESFYADSNAKPALDHLFDKVSAENLNDLVDQMKNDPDENVRKNAEILSDVLKDSRMSVEAEGMITTTLAMFLQQMSKEQQ